MSAFGKPIGTRYCELLPESLVAIMESGFYNQDSKKWHRKTLKEFQDNPSKTTTKMHVLTFKELMTTQENFERISRQIKQIPTLSRKCSYERTTTKLPFCLLLLTSSFEKRSKPLVLTNKKRETTIFFLLFSRLRNEHSRRI